MPVEEGEFTDGLGRKIKTFKWGVEGEPKALVFFCHGYAERLLPYYSALAETAAESELLCFGHDHPGHGLSEGERVQVASMSEYVDPVITHCTSMTTLHPSLPLYIVGHSMGGLIALLAVLQTQQSTAMFKGMVLMGPLIELAPETAGTCMKLLARIASKIAPNFALGGIDPKLVTSDDSWIKKKEEDPLHYKGGMKAQHGMVLISVLDSLHERFGDVSTNYLILHGEEDKICKPEGSQRLHEATVSKDKTLKVVKGGLHNLYVESEPISSNAMKTTVDWIVKRVHSIV